MSGGVDSCTLAAVAHEILGDQMLAITLSAESSSSQEIEDATRFARTHGIPHEVRTHSELEDPDYVRNDLLRCYHCRKGMAGALQAAAGEHGLETIAMGVVPDDQGEHRPGIRAAREAGIWFPLVEAEVAKAEVREIASTMGLEVHDKPSNACLSSRIAYGLEVTEPRLRRIEAAEALIRETCEIRQVRVRYHEGDVARIEVAPAARGSVLAHADEITAELKELGFTFVALDLLGYRSGAMNESIGDS